MVDCFHIAFNVLPQSINLPMSEFKMLFKAAVGFLQSWVQRGASGCCLHAGASHSCLLLQDFVNRRYIHSAGIQECLEQELLHINLCSFMCHALLQDELQYHSVFLTLGPRIVVQRGKRTCEELNNDLFMSLRPEDIAVQRMVTIHCPLVVYKQF